MLQDSPHIIHFKRILDFGEGQDIQYILRTFRGGLDVDTVVRRINSELGRNDPLDEIRFALDAMVSAGDVIREENLAATIAAAHAGRVRRRP